MGVKGWHTRGYLPHYDGWDISQHVVFRLVDALPPGCRGGDDELDRGYGSALLREPDNAHIVAEALLHFDTERYRLHAWCVMPNHVHVLLDTQVNLQLGAIVRSWKGYSAARINTRLRRRGSLWARDYFDRFIRDGAHFEATKHYIEMNPVRAGLCDAPDAWRFSSAGLGRGD